MKHAATLKINGTEINLGQFNTKEEANEQSKLAFKHADIYSGDVNEFKDTLNSYKQSSI